MTIVVRKLFHDFPRKNYKQIWGSLLLAVTIFFSAPLSVFLVNQNTLKFTFQDALPFYLGYTLLAFVILAALSIALKRFWRYLVVIYVALSLGFVIQGNYLLYDLGKLDGHTIEWSAFYRYIPIELLVWVGLIVAAVIFRKKIYKNFMFAAGLVFLLAIVPVLGQVISKGFSSPNANPKQYFDYSKQFEFSSEKNVVVIVLDTFRSDAFEEIIESNPKYGEAFKDFTFYSNAATGYPNTMPAIPLILTGLYYDNTQPFSDFVASIQERSLPNFLLEHGVRVESYPFAYSLPASWSNLSEQIPDDVLRVRVNKQLFVTYLRYLPLPFKPFFVDQYYSGKEYTHKDIVDFYGNTEKTAKKRIDPVFKFIHLSGAHPPFQLDADFNRIDKGYMEQAKASINAVVKFINEMKEAEVYDNSQIIILGDHGANLPKSPDEAYRNDMDTSSLYRPDGMLLKAEPLLLAKNYQQQKDRLTVTNVPVSLGDIPKTVADSLGLQNNFEGFSIFEEIPEDRIRQFFYFDWGDLDGTDDFLPMMYEYHISGNISSVDSWEFQNKLYSMDGVSEVQFPNYEYGSNMVSSILTSSDYILFTPGFENRYDPEKPVWASAPKSCIYLQPAATTKSLILEIQGSPFIVKDILEKQRMVISIDEEEIAVLDAVHDMWVPIPSDTAERLTSDQKLQLCFEFPDAKSPQEVGMNDDHRLLGYRFSHISLLEEQPIGFPLKVFFTQSNPPTEAHLTGFSGQEQNFTWTDKNTASIQLVIPETEDDLGVSFLASPFLVPGSLDSQRVIIRVNEQEITQLEMEKAEEISLTIPADLNTGLLKIEFELPDAASPYEHGLSEDRRLLGIAIHWLQIYEK